METRPIEILRLHLGLSGSALARETGISRASITNAQRGEGLGRKVIRRIQSRWPLELRQLGLTSDDFLEGRVLRLGVTDPVTTKRRKAS